MGRPQGCSPSTTSSALPFDEQYGGTGTGTLMLQMAVEEIAKVCASSALILMVQELGTLPIQLFGSDELKERFLPRCATGEWSPALLPQRARGRQRPRLDAHDARCSTATSGSSTAQRTGSPTPTIADFYVVFAKTDRETDRITAFVVEKDREGFDPGKLEHKLGIKGSPTGEPTFDDVRVPPENVIGEVGRGLARRAGHAGAHPPGRRPRRRSGSPRARSTTRRSTPRSASPSASRSSSCRRSSTSSPTCRPRTAAARELLYKACAMADRNEPDLGK